ncbi:hypothetical protein GL213_10215 [Halogeometricum borinquense]|uniref:Uncharacterized protein n=2 Tax=Halogeometricum borinquense TaxID=60847 RepID=E4NP82_HALBP|nr:hypothetical protein [Halogeometricum borinquense]ADQ67623.1 hypothetical protein Hbor_20570 [Halogeometricum borinquense DSM 11551]ELY23696.1 hypothetical protein C499_18134 [Halogeometricum borinquense DSM 11551]QIB73785.1 hypothetical protein G3I44_05460 [Halogeometricum borinquense]QIQ76858.1 hypothetical protein GL213_10215 [Halogeometricum borinquense]RYJ13430.1 hypothetical protein ELS19_05255 [Halogeometricum borinquense]
MQTESVQSDKGIGFAVLFSIITVIGAAGMIVGDQLTAAVGFAVAIIAASLAVVAAQTFW